MARKAMGRTRLLAVSVSLLFLSIALASCVKEVKKPAFEGLTLEEIVAKINESTKQIKTYETKGKIRLNFIFKDSKGGKKLVGMGGLCQVHGIWDLMNEKSWTITKQSIRIEVFGGTAHEKSKTDMYILGDTAYMKSRGPKGSRWKKMRLSPELKEGLMG